MTRTNKEKNNVIKLRLHPTSKELIEWRKNCLEDLLSRVKPSSSTYKEYAVRLKELDWLISKLN